MLRDHGYYAFSKDYITFVADTAEDARDVNLTLNLRQPSAQSPDRRHLTYLVDKVVFVTDYNPGTDYGNYDFKGQDTVRYRDITVLYGSDHYLRPQVLYEASHIMPGRLFSQHEVDLTYEALGRLGILRYVNIDMRRAGTSPDGRLVEAVELPDEPFFVGVQYHPEFKSRPTRPHPLFRGFVGAACARSREGA